MVLFHLIVMQNVRFQQIQIHIDRIYIRSCKPVNVSVVNEDELKSCAVMLCK
jgi:hypothetical protein